MSLHHRVLCLPATSAKYYFQYALHDKALRGYSREWPVEALFGAIIIFGEVKSVHLKLKSYKLNSLLQQGGRDKKRRRRVSPSCRLRVLLFYVDILDTL